MSLKIKFSVLSVFILTLLVLGVSVFFYRAEKIFLVEKLKEKQYETIRQFAALAGEALLVNDELLVYNYAKLLKKTNAAVSYAMFVNEKGIAVAHTDPSLLYKEVQSGKWKVESDTAVSFNGSRRLQPALAQESMTKSDAPVSLNVRHNILVSREVFSGLEVVEFAQEVFSGSQKKGIAGIGYSKKILDEEIAGALSEIKKRIRDIALAGFLVSFISSYFMVRIFINPVTQIAAGVQKIGEGHLETTFPAKRKDELGLLATELNRMAERLRELDELKRDFVASVTHELRSPLAAIQVFLDIMLSKIRKKDSALDWEDTVLSIRNNTSRLGRFINDLLDLSKIEAGKIDVNPQRMDLIPAVKEVVELFIPQARDKKIELSLQNDGLEKLFVRGDSDRLKQVVTNLVNNALKFTPEAGSVTVELAPEPEQAEYIRVSVRDSGLGIPEDSVGKIFNKFEQVKGMRDKIKGPKGTGLGLSIAKAIVELHKGELRVESVYGQGSVFYFTLLRSEL